MPEVSALTVAEPTLALTLLPPVLALPETDVLPLDAETEVLPPEVDTDALPADVETEVPPLEVDTDALPAEVETEVLLELDPVLVLTLPTGVEAEAVPALEDELPEEEPPVEPLSEEPVPAVTTPPVLPEVAPEPSLALLEPEELLVSLACVVPVFEVDVALFLSCLTPAWCFVGVPALEAFHLRVGTPAGTTYISPPPTRTAVRSSRACAPVR